MSKIDLYPDSARVRPVFKIFYHDYSFQLAREPESPEEDMWAAWHLDNLLMNGWTYRKGQL